MRPESEEELVVLYADGASAGAGAAAVRRAGGTVVSTNAAIGTASVRADDGFARRVAASPAVAGAARDRSIGTSGQRRHAKSGVEKERVAGRGPAAPRPGAPAAEPLAGLQWDMQQIGATPTGSYAVQRGATDVPCPTPGTLVYPDLPAAYTATCEGTTDRNGFYGDGLVNALRAVTSRR